MIERLNGYIVVRMKKQYNHLAIQYAFLSNSPTLLLLFWLDQRLLAQTIQ